MDTPQDEREKPVKELVSDMVSGEGKAHPRESEKGFTDIFSDILLGDATPESEGR